MSIENSHQHALSELRLWQLISPALPVGAYAYSQGLEFAVENRWVHDVSSCHDWVSGQLRHNLCNLDIPVLQRLQQAWSENNVAQVLYWNQYLLSSRETQELLNEDRQLGIALSRLLTDLDISTMEALREQGADHISFATAFSLAAQHWKIPAKNAARGYIWAWCENQVAAAVKLIPLGQTAGQQLLADLADMIPAAIEACWSLSNEDIGNTSYGVSMASAFHESQYTRLFRS